METNQKILIAIIGIELCVIVTTFLLWFIKSRNTAISFRLWTYVIYGWILAIIFGFSCAFIVDNRKWNSMWKLTILIMPILWILAFVLLFVKGIRPIFKLIHFISTIFTCVLLGFALDLAFYTFNYDLGKRPFYLPALKKKPHDLTRTHETHTESHDVVSESSVRLENVSRRPQTVNLAVIKADQKWCNGGYSSDEAKEYQKHFNQQMTNLGLNIQFVDGMTDKITGWLTGGTCSVKTIILIRMFFTFLDENNELGLEKSKITQSGGEYATMLSDFFQNQLQGTDTATRALQAAMNTITVTGGLTGHTAHKEKVKGLLALTFNDQSVDEEHMQDVAPLISHRKYTDIPLQLDPEFEPQYVDLITRKDIPSVKSLIDKLDVGEYFIRLIKESMNVKLETSGHSTALLIGTDKDNGQKVYIFFNPNYTSRLLSDAPVDLPQNKDNEPKTSAVSQIVRDLYEAASRWQVFYVGVYKILEPKSI